MSTTPLEIEGLLAEHWSVTLYVLELYADMTRFSSDLSPARYNSAKADALLQIDGRDALLDRIERRAEAFGGFIDEYVDGCFIRYRYADV